MAGGKHALFYSRDPVCEFSSEIVDTIVKRGLRDRFTFVCVEAYSDKLPSFVDCVPLLYTTNHEVLTDDDLVFFVDNLRTPAAVPQPSRLPTAAASTDSVGDSFDGFDGLAAVGFSSYDGSTDDFVSTPFETFSNQGSRVVSSLGPPVDTREKDHFDGDLERYMAQREADDAIIVAR